MWAPRLLFVLVGILGYLWTLGGGCAPETCQSSADCSGGRACVSGKCSSAEASGEPVADRAPADRGLPPCPKRCNTDRDCLFCGDRKTCDTQTNTCVDIRKQCPTPCNKDEDCQREGCGARTTCNTDISECVERIAACPDSCKTDEDCKAGGCGPRSQCSTQFNTCVDPTVANCPVNCKDDAGCKECGERDQCSFSTPTATTGICRKFGQHECPSFCRSAADCFTKGCGEKKFCNYALGQCVTKDKICAYSCDTDADCSANCGTRTFCYKSAPGVRGYCFNPPTATQCPARCNSSFDCKAKDCGAKLFCNFQSNACVAEVDACPGTCSTDADCPAAKCGATARCRSGRCFSR